MIALQEHTPVLLTGATGLIGGELLRAFLNAGLGRVSTLIRSTPQADIRTRIRARLRRSGWDPGAMLDQADVVAGDVRLPTFDLRPEDAARIRSEVRIILHSACETSFIRGRSCYETNVVGMRHLIDFARSFSQHPLIVYMSTAANGGIIAHRCLSEAEGCKPDAQHHNEYTHSKAVAEQMLWDSGLPALVLRPSIVLSAGLPDPQFARAILWFVPLLNELGGGPVDPASRLDIVPTSFVVDATLALLRKPDRNYNCYHLSAGPKGSMTCGDIADFLNVYYEHVTPLHFVPPAQWTRELHRKHVSGPANRKIFSTLRHYLPFLNMDVVYDNSRLAADLGEEAVRVPRLTSYMGELLDIIPTEAAVQEAYNP